METLVELSKSNTATSAAWKGISARVIKVGVNTQFFLQCHNYHGGYNEKCWHCFPDGWPIKTHASRQKNEAHKYNTIKSINRRINVQKFPHETSVAIEIEDHRSALTAAYLRACITYTYWLLYAISSLFTKQKIYTHSRYWSSCGLSSHNSWLSVWVSHL